MQSNDNLLKKLQEITNQIILINRFLNLFHGLKSLLSGLFMSSKKFKDSDSNYDYDSDSDYNYDSDSKDKMRNNEYKKMNANLKPQEKINVIKNLVSKMTSENEYETAKKIILIVEIYPTNLSARYSYIQSIGYALTNRKCLNSISIFLKDSKTFEIGAGSGFLTLVLKSYCNIDITATDKAQNLLWLQFQKCKVFDVSEDKYPSDVNAIVVSWPKLYLESLMKNLPDTIKRIVIIGEYEGGCTDCLCKVDNGVCVYEINKEVGNAIYPFRQVDIKTHLPSFYCINDFLSFYERNN
ncbi:hypothetical protein Hokovirus_1_338 [Hokovirus HKV1]|uniref:Methyltransferase n=1 Tax=Hokovirus HKV1 TaxID=1977638 RepID=A0A1V0SFF8_9VIRU|nr:hypothetical protein Hokovirus_1_338 [Hokovirus HKV1]